MESSWCKSSPVKAVAGGPVASVAIRRVTGGCEAYTARTQAVRISSEIVSALRMPTPLALRKAASGQPSCEVGPGSPESLARGMRSKGFPANPGELPTSSESGCGAAQPKCHQVPGERGFSPREAKPPSTRRNLLPRETGGVRPRVEEQSYEPIATDEGGEPQGSRKGRPRYPLEGRGEQVDASTRLHIVETPNSGIYVQWN